MCKKSLNFSLLPYFLFIFFTFSCRHTIKRSPIPINPSPSVEDPSANSQDTCEDAGILIFPTSVDLSPSSSACRDEHGKDARVYFTTPDNNGDITLPIKDNSDIWYMYTNTTGDNIYNRRVNSSVFEHYLYPKFPPLSPVSLEPVAIKDIDIPLSGFGKEDFQYYDIHGDDYVGRRCGFYDVAVQKRYFYATCVAFRRCDTEFGERAVAIYVEDDMNSNPSVKSLPTQADYEKFLNVFLRDGYDNDIYDKMTSLFGNDQGFFNSNFLKSHASSAKSGFDCEDLIPPADTITILYCDIAKSGTPKAGESYISGYYWSGNLLKSSNEYYSSQRPMIVIHAPASCDSNIGEGIVTIAHEFQHLIHDQYFNEDLTNYGFARPLEDNPAVDEIFSATAEIYISQMLSELTAEDIPGPFYVSYDGNDKGFVSISSEQAEKISTSGRMPYYLAYSDSRDIFKWSAGDLADYGLVTCFANYLLLNYGTEVFRGYVNGGLADLDGIIQAINTSYTKANITKSRLIKDWGISMLLSSYPSFSSPYAMNRNGWYRIDGMKIPSLNAYIYRPFSSNGVYGFNSTNASLKSSYKNNTNTLECVRRNFLPGNVYNDKIPLSDLAPGLELTVVAVPR